MKQNSRFSYLIIAFAFTGFITVGCNGNKSKKTPQKEESKVSAITINPSNTPPSEEKEVVKFSAPCMITEEVMEVGYASYDLSIQEPSKVEEYSISEPENNDKYKGLEENPFIQVSKQDLTTFSVDADGGSYSNARRYLMQDKIKPPVESIRIEEFINFFPYDYPDPKGTESVSIHSEITTCPWNDKNHLLRIGIKGRSIPNAQKAASNFVFLIDVSGSMEPTDKLPLLKEGFIKMANGLSKDDRISIVTYAGASAVLLDGVPGNKKKQIKEAINQLGAGGSTAGADGINTAYEIAMKNFILGGNNRVILGTDGDFNVGLYNTDELIKLIEKKRETGIYLTTLGVGHGNLNDHMMEQLANKGNGNYEYIDNSFQVEKVFIHEKEKFFTVANDCKIQLRFNADQIESYRLVGYENRFLENKDFEDDKKDAGEIGASQTITAIYEVVLNNNISNSFYASMGFRYKLPGYDKSQLIEHNIQSTPVEISKASSNMRFAGAVVAFGLILKQSKYKGTANKTMILELVKNTLGYDPYGYRKEFVKMIAVANL